MTSFDDLLRSEMISTVKQIVTDRVVHRAAAIDQDAAFPVDICDLFSGIGMLGLTVPSTYQGVGAPLALTSEIISIIAEACGTSANIVMQQALGIAPILHAGSEQQKERWLPGMATGRLLGSFCLTEPDAGSDNAAMTTTAERFRDEYIVSGSKVFCTWAPIAGIATIFARSSRDPDGDGFVALVTELPAPGFIVGKPEQKMGLRGSPTAEVALDGLRVPVSNRLGLPGDGLRIALASLDAGRVEVASLSLGLARGAIKYASRHLNNREQFGKKLSTFQGLRFRVADLITEIEAAALLVQRAAAAIDAEEPAGTRLAAMAKLYATDSAMRVTTEAVQLLGGYGYLQDHPVERMMRDAKLFQIVEGTNEIQRHVIAREWFSDIENFSPAQGSSGEGHRVGFA